VKSENFVKIFQVLATLEIHIFFWTWLGTMRPPGFLLRII